MLRRRIGTYGWGVSDRAETVHSPGYGPAPDRSWFPSDRSIGENARPLESLQAGLVHCGACPQT